MDKNCFPHNTSIRTIKNSAISSWGGFVYQAMCALCVMMEDLLDNKDDTVNERKLNIEGYEDFAIVDSNDNILSFHQAKCYKNYANFEEEFSKMEDKRLYWHKEGKCENDTPLYFHTNLVDVACTHGVERYRYRDNSLSLSPKEVLDKFHGYVVEYLCNHRLPGNSEIIGCKMINHIQQVVIELDEKGKRGTIDMQQASIDKSTPYIVFFNYLESNDKEISTQDLIRSTMFYLGFWITERIIEDPNEKDEYINEFLERLNSLSEDEKEKLIKRIFPDKDICNSKNIFAELTNSIRAYNLKRLLCAMEGIDLETISWNCNGDLCTPSTLGEDTSTRLHALHIIQNKNKPVELLRDYRWIVGNVQTTEENIFDIVNDITAVESIKYDNITENRKVGIIKAEDINHG